MIAEYEATNNLGEEDFDDGGEDDEYDTEDEVVDEEATLD